jgi:hypothetical protein
MFSFNEDHYDAIEKNISHGEAIEKYPDSYMVVMNGHLEDKKVHGDIVALLTWDEYIALEKPNNIVPKFGFWVGNAMMEWEVYNSLGFSV